MKTHYETQLLLQKIYIFKNVTEIVLVRLHFIFVVFSSD
jgi:hypothetical protein